MNWIFRWYTAIAGSANTIAASRSELIAKESQNVLTGKSSEISFIATHGSGVLVAPSKGNKLAATSSNSSIQGG